MCRNPDTANSFVEFIENGEALKGSTLPDSDKTTPATEAEEEVEVEEDEPE